MTVRTFPISLLALIACGASSLHAQDTGRVTNAAEAAQRQTKLPSNQPAADATGVAVSSDEVEDVGEQHLLVAKPAHNWFAVMADAQSYYTDNAALTESGKVWSDVAVLSAQAAVKFPEIELGDAGKLATSAGYRYQDFYYGALSGRTNHDVNGAGLTLDELNFRTHTGFARADWTTSSGWFASSEGRFTAYIASSVDRTSYQEWVPSFAFGKRILLSERDLLTVSADADYRFNHTMFTIGDIGSDLNERYDLGVNLAYAHVFGESWVIQPAYRFQFSDFTRGAGTTNEARKDYLHSLSLTVAYVVNDNFSVRAFASYEMRDAVNSPDDYRAGLVGAGLMATASF